jgi:hypothetical protein
MELLEKELLDCWFDCLQRPFKIKKEIENNQLSDLAKTLFLKPAELQQKLIMAIRQIDRDLFLDEEIKQLLIDALLQFSHIKRQGEEEEKKEEKKQEQRQILDK